MSRFEGTWRLIRLALRLDRIKLTISILFVALLVPMFIAGVSEIFASDEEMVRGIAFLAVNPAMRLFGLPTGGDIGNLLMLRSFNFFAIIIALINTFTVIRHTRQNEELGRSELIGAGVVGRYSGLMAAVTVTAMANAIMTVLIFIGLRTGDLPVEGALLMAVALGVIGMAFSGMAAVCAQLTQTSRGANGLAAAGIGAAFLLSGIGSVLGNLQPDGLTVEPAWISWLTPFGWGQLLMPFADHNWWILGIFMIFWAACMGCALVLINMRDVGSGIFQARPGKHSAKIYLLSITGLTWRLNKNVFIGWLIGIALLGVIYGVVAGDAEDLLTHAEGIAEMFVAATGSEEIMLAFFGSTMSVISIFVLAYAVQLAVRFRSEETRALEFLFSGNVSRIRWLLVNTGFIFVSSTIILLITGFVTGLVGEYVMEESIDILWSVIVGAIVQLPAIMLLVGFVVAVFGIMPRWTNGLAWTAVFASILFGPLVGSLLHVPDWLLEVSPFTHTPVVPPMDNIELIPLVILSGISITFFIVGLVAFQRRDIANTQ